MRWLFVVSTPFQLYYAATIVLEKLDTNDQAELLLTPQFPSAFQLAKQFQEEKIFEAIHICPVEFNTYSLYKIQLKAYFGKSGFCPKSLLNKHFDYYALSMPAYPNSGVYFALRKANKDLKVIFFEDGTGTYTGEIFRNATYLGIIPKGVQRPSKRARIYRAIFGVLPKKLNTYSPAKILVRQPEAIYFQSPFPVEQVTIQEKNLSRIHSCFGTPSSLPQDIHAIILDPARTTNESINELDYLDSLIGQLASRGVKVALKEHPRTTNPSKQKEYCFQIPNDLWELYCRHNSLTDKLLIGIGSSAQLTPVLENSEKPPLLFLYKLFIKRNSETYSNYETIVEIAKRMYEQDAEKLILVPRTAEEATTLVSSFIAKHDS